MKKLLNLYVLFFIALLSVGMASCSSSDGPDTEEVRESLQGTWVAEYAQMKAAGQTVKMTIDEIRDAAAASGQPTQFYDEVLVFSGDRVNGKRYSLNGNKFRYLDYPDYEDIEFTLKVSDTNLYMILKEQGIEVTMVYKKR